MGIFSWLKGGELNQEEEQDLAMMKGRISTMQGEVKKVVKKPQITFDVKVPKLTMGEPSRTRGIAYPDGAGWRLIWQRRDGTQSESYSKTRPVDFRFANSKDEAVKLAGKPTQAANKAKPGPAVKADAGKVPAIPAVKPEAASKPPDALAPRSAEAKPDNEPFNLEPPPRPLRSKGQRISPPMPRLR